MNAFNALSIIGKNDNSKLEQNDERNVKWSNHVKEERNTDGLIDVICFQGKRNDWHWKAAQNA